MNLTNDERLGAEWFREKITFQRSYLRLFGTITAIDFAWHAVVTRLDSRGFSQHSTFHFPSPLSVCDKITTPIVQYGETLEDGEEFFSCWQTFSVVLFSFILCYNGLPAVCTLNVIKHSLVHTLNRVRLLVRLARNYIWDISPSIGHCSRGSNFFIGRGWPILGNALYKLHPWVFMELSPLGLLQGVQQDVYPG